MAKESNIGYLSLPAAVNWLNSIDAFLSSKGKSPVHFTASSLMDAAVKHTGLSDWGEDDVLPGLKQLVSSIHEEAGLHLLGKYLCKIKLLEILKNRLCIEREFTDTPEIADERIRAPLFIASFPRTGTTLLHSLVALDGSMRFVRGWESIYPSLHPEYKKKGRDPRPGLRENEIRMMKRFVPGALSVHPLTTKGPEECHFLLAHTFRWPLTFEILFDIPSFVTWAKAQDKVPVYRYYKKMLQLFQWHSPASSWVLKSPDHLSGLDALLEVFPDAKIVFIQRDPVDVLPSFFNLIAMGRSLHSNRVDVNEIGREYSARLYEWMEKTTAVRSAHSPDHFYDLQYRDLVKNPVEALRGIYDYFDYPFTPEFEQNARQWLSVKTKRKEKTHNCTPEDFGLNNKRIRDLFQPAAGALN